MTEIVLRTLLWGAGGSVIFTVLLVAMRSLGVVDATRNPDGTFKRLGVKSFLGFITIVVLMVGFPAVGALSVLGQEIRSFWPVWGAAYGIYCVINLFDFVVLDYLVIVRWHPDFLALPDTDYYRTTRPHAVGFVRGTIIGLPATLASAGLVLVLA